MTVAVFVLVVAVAISGLTFRNFLVQSQIRSMHVRGEQISRVMQGYFVGNISGPAAGSLIRALQGTLNDRLLVVDSTGNRLLESTRGNLPNVHFPLFILRQVLLQGQPWEGTLNGPQQVVAAAGVPVTVHGVIMGGILLEAPLSGVNQTAASLTSILFWVQLVAVALAALMAYSLSRRLSRPLEELRHLVAETGTSLAPRRLAVEGPIEVEDLAEEFNRMHERIEQQVIRLEHEKATRDALLAHVAHDLRTPMTSIRGFLEAIRDGVAVGPSQDRAVSVALEETLRLQRLVNRLLEMTRIRSGTVGKESVALNRWIEETLNRIGPVMERRNVKIEWRHGEDAEFSGVLDHLIEALINVLDNAIKWSPPNGVIQLETEVSREGREIQIRVRDHGPGIDPALLPQVFERFVTGDLARSDSSGIGLSIVADVMQEHGGTAAIGNHPEDGCVVTLTLPFTP